MPKSSAKPFHREIILGIDPGSLVTGWGLIELIGTELHHRAHGTIATNAAMALPARLNQIHTGLLAIIERHRPATVSLEKVFFFAQRSKRRRLLQYPSRPRRGIWHPDRVVNGKHSHSVTELTLWVTVPVRLPGISPRRHAACPGNAHSTTR